MLELLKELIDLFLHLDKELGSIIRQYGIWTYLLLFLVIFCETGLVVTPFLPGDSLLFATGAFAAQEFLNVFLLFFLLTAAAIIGDSVNYRIGSMVGPKVFQRQNSRIFKQEYLDKTHAFYEKYGAKTIVLARFVPIVRTFAPFVAGVGAMSYWRFLAYNVIGGLLWITIFVFGGYFFGNLPFVKENFSLVILAIIAVSVLPGFVEFIRHRRGS